MNTQERINAFNQHYAKTRAIQYAQSLINFDAATGAPKKAVNDRAEVLGYFALEGFLHSTSAEYEKILSDLEEVMEELTPEMKRMVSQGRKELNKTKKIPPQEYQDYSILLAKAEAAWEEAKHTSNFSLFAPYLEKIVNYTKKFATYFGPVDGHLYNTLLDDYEEGLTMPQLDKFFATLKARIVPLVKKIGQSKVKPNTQFVDQKFDKAKQLQLSERVLQLIGFDLSRGVLKESVHPFTNEVSPNDTRLTTRIYEDYFISNIYSTAHEGGHAIYEQNINPAYKNTPLGHGASMSIHESQSRFYENIVCRSRAFMDLLLIELQRLFPEQIKGVTADQLYQAVNIAKPSLIRVEADELTYALHIMVRYEIEKMLIEESLEVKDLPRVWNEKMKEYLGIVPPDDAQGVLQDVHWSGGAFGYFPTYALGTAYSVQLLNAMEKELKVTDTIQSGHLEPIREWFNNHLYVYGRLLPPLQLLEKATGEPFNAEYFCDYLEQKFSKLYSL